MCEDLADATVESLKNFSFVFASESELQDSIATALKSEGIEFDREVSLSCGERVDFLLSSGVGLEIKTSGSISQVASQLQRYAACARVSALVLVTTRAAHAELPGWLSEKPLRVLVVRGGIS